jgi:hypothetical protein
MYVVLNIIHKNHFYIVLLLQFMGPSGELGLEELQAGPLRDMQSQNSCGIQRF